MAIGHYDPQWNLRDGERKEWEIRAERSPKRVRVKFGKVTIADSKRALLVTETGKLPVYYFPESDVRKDLFEPSDYRQEHPIKGEAVYWDIHNGDSLIESAVWSYPQPEGESSVLRGYYSFVWKKADAWYEEDEEIFVHALDPYTRIDAIPSSRHIQVVINGKIIADSKRPVVLFETGLTPRYYIPLEDVRVDLLEPSDTTTRCPYKGIASYWNANVNGRAYSDVVWSYRKPLPEVHEIARLLSFYNERVDAVYVDGKRWSLEDQDRLPYSGVS